LFLLKGNPLLLLMTMMINATMIRCSYRDDWCVEESAVEVEADAQDGSIDGVQREEGRRIGGVF
jgi:hypothetical protein